MLRLSVPRCKHRSKSGGDVMTKSTVARSFCAIDRHHSCDGSYLSCTISGLISVEDVNGIADRKNTSDSIVEPQRLKWATRLGRVLPRKRCMNDVIPLRNPLGSLEQHCWSAVPSQQTLIYW